MYIIYSAGRVQWHGEESTTPENQDLSDHIDFIVYDLSNTLYFFIVILRVQQNWVEVNRHFSHILYCNSFEGGDSHKCFIFI